MENVLKYLLELAGLKASGHLKTLSWCFILPVGSKEFNTIFGYKTIQICKAGNRWILNSAHGGIWPVCGGKMNI